VVNVIKIEAKFEKDDAGLCLLMEVEDFISSF